MSKACANAPLPERAGVIKAGVSPDGQSYLLAVTATTNQPAGCEVFYQVDIRMRNKSFFLGLNTNRVYTRVFRAKDALTGPRASHGDDFRGQEGRCIRALARSRHSGPWGRETLPSATSARER